MCKVLLLLFFFFFARSYRNKLCKATLLRMLGGRGRKTESEGLLSFPPPPPPLSSLLLCTITDGFGCSLINVEKEKKKRKHILLLLSGLSSPCGASPWRRSVISIGRNSKQSLSNATSAFFAGPPPSPLFDLLLTFDPTGQRLPTWPALRERPREEPLRPQDALGVAPAR